MSFLQLLRGFPGDLYKVIAFCWDNYKDSLSKQTTKVTISSDLVGQTASGGPSYIQVRHAGADFLGPGAQKHQFKDQKPKKRIILSPLSDPLQTL